MPSIRSTSHDLLDYNAQYGVLICLKCQYAIQKSAVASHLLKHKIYRNEREQLLSAIAHLDLLEPHRVSLPTPSSPPIGSLPVISGYHCISDGCENLCASSKRMRRHWSEVHGVGEQSLGLENLAREAKLQTFFRGTKIKYFEVGANSTKILAIEEQLFIAGGGRTDEEIGVKDPANTPIRTSPQPRPMIKVSDLQPVPCTFNLDLETLTYFHNFITTTSLTLLTSAVQHYWQTDVVAISLQHRWLICGLLAISASHMAVAATDLKSKKGHCEKFAQFFEEFSTRWAETDSLELGAAGENEARKTASRMMPVLRCAQWALSGSPPDVGDSLKSVPFQLDLFIGVIRGLLVSEPSSEQRGENHQNDDRQRTGSVQAEKLLEIDSTLKHIESTTTSPSLRNSSSNNTASQALIRLQGLPYRMAAVLGKPDNAQDVLATLSAIAALIECCNISFTDEAGAALRSMVNWLYMVPEDFDIMIKKESPAALVVLAHWAAFSLGRVGTRSGPAGFWFLEGMAQRVLRDVGERLAANNYEVQSLVEDLMRGKLG